MNKNKDLRLQNELKLLEIQEIILKRRQKHAAVEAELVGLELSLVFEERQQLYARIGGDYEAE